MTIIKNKKHYLCGIEVIKNWRHKCNSECRTGFKLFNQLEAIKYLKKNSVYRNEWQGAGMWEAVEKILSRNSQRFFKDQELDALLKEAENR